MEERVFDKMVVSTADNTAEMAAAAAARAAVQLRDSIDARGSANAMFATGNSQLGFIDKLVSIGDVDWSRVVMFHMDDYVGMGADHPAAFRRYIRARLEERTHPLETHYIAGDAADPDEECRRYAALLDSHPLDLCVLGIGENGHLAFNDPPVANFDDPLDVKVVELDAPCRRQQVGEGHFRSVEEVPTHAITVTVPALLRARTVIAVVPEIRKAAPVRDALTGPVRTACPASILRTRDNTHLYLDKESASLLPPLPSLLPPPPR